MAVGARAPAMTDEMAVVGDPGVTVQTGMHFVVGPNVPSAVVTGGVLRVDGTVHFECPTCLIGREGRVVLESPDLADRQINLGILEHCETTPFQFEIPIDFEPGTTITLSLRADRNPPVGDWETDDRTRLFDVDVVTEGEALQRAAIEWGKWVAPGAVGGAVLGPKIGQTRVGGAALGGAVGAGGKFATERGVTAIQRRFPTVSKLDLALGVALLGAGGFFLSQARSTVPG